MLVPPAGPPDRRRRVGYLLAGSAAALFAVNASVSKVVLLGGMPSQALTELRSAAAFAALGGWLLLTRPQSLRVTRRELPHLALLGIVGFAFVQWFYFVAIGRLPVSIALLLEYTAPVLVALWARFGAREPVRRRVWAALALALAGLAMVAEVWGGSDLDGVGVLAGLAAAGAWAFYFVYGERLVTTRDSLSLTFFAFGFATVFWSVLRPWWDFPWALLGTEVSLLGNLADVTAPMWLLVAWLVVLGTVVPFSLLVSSLQHLRATQAGLVSMTEPVLATVVAFVWLAEALSPAQVVGGAVVLVGVVLAETARTTVPAR
jgi:drug/metabolite transporter (DMT)-like permease